MSTQESHSESLDDFVAHSTAYRERLHQTGRPIVLTVNGQPDVVVQDAAAYRRMEQALAEAERRETIAAVLRGKADATAGRTTPAQQAIKEIAQELGLNAPGS